MRLSFASLKTLGSEVAAISSTLSIHESFMEIRAPILLMVGFPDVFSYANHISQAQ